MASREVDFRSLAAVIAVGDELLQDQIDINGQALQVRLAEQGIETRIRCVLPDDRKYFVKILRTLISEHPLIICCGGLGPTQDDITRQAIAAAIRQPLVFHPQAHRDIEKHFQKRDVVMPALNRIQAMFPQTAIPLKNAHGTAPGFLVPTKSGLIAALPGPPLECLSMFDQELMPRLRGYMPRPNQTLHRRIIRTSGISESRLQEKIGPCFANQKEITLGFLLDEPGEILIILTVRNQSTCRAQLLFRQAEEQVRQQLGMDLVDLNGKELAAVVGDLLRQRQQTVAVAESCTGGLIAQRITAIPGSSQYFVEGTVVYSNQAKIRRLQISAPGLARHGTVSEWVAKQMALGIRKSSQADWGIAVTGIAGPGGETPAKPVGLVYLGVAGPDRFIQIRQWRFSGDRQRIQRLGATAALDLLRRSLLMQIPQRKDLTEGF